MERLEHAIDIAIFNADDKLPQDANQKTANIAEMKRSYLLSSLGASSYKLLKSYCTPNTPSEKTYDELKTILKNNLAPKISTVSEQYRFNQLKQETNENLSLFMARLKKAVTTCGFEGQYDTMVRNRFICGLKSEKIRTSLLSEATDETTADIVLKKAIAK